jgi:hypothetical protein
MLYETQKHYNYLQRLLKQKVLTRVIKMPSFHQGLGAKTKWSNEKWEEVQAL